MLGAFSVLCGGGDPRVWVPFFVRAEPSGYEMVTTWFWVPLCHVMWVTSAGARSAWIVLHGGAHPPGSF